MNWIFYFPANQVLLCDAYDIVYNGKGNFGRIAKEIIINEKILIKEALGVAYIKNVRKG